VPDAKALTKLKPSTRQQDLAVHLAILDAAREPSAELSQAELASELPPRVARVMQAMIRAQRSILGADGLHSTHLTAAVGLPAQGGSPGLGRR
jgi:hypothetical protein